MRLLPRRSAEPTGVTRWSLVPASQAAVWARVTTPEGINDELWPLIRMTVPSALRDTRIDRLAEGEPIGRAWLLAGGVVPFDVDDMTLAVIDPPHRFREDSRLIIFPQWSHDRRVRVVAPDICSVEDRLSWTARGVLGRHRSLRAVQRIIVGALFTHRHRRLVAHFRLLEDPDPLADDR
jgi:hypothetical protein